MRRAPIDYMTFFRSNDLSCPVCGRPSCCREHRWVSSHWLAGYRQALGRRPYRVRKVTTS